MNRRTFLRNTSALAAGMAVSPAGAAVWNSRPASGSAVRHVVLCVAGGGVRHTESVGMREGNLMPGLFDGLLSARIPGRLKNSFAGLSPLTQSGTLFPNFRYRGAAAGHRMALFNLLNGNLTDEHDIHSKDLSQTELFKSTSGKAVLITPDRPFYASTGFRDGRRRHILAGNSSADQLYSAKPLFSPKLSRHYEDLKIAETAADVMLTEKPEFMCVTFFGADEAHGSFTRYAENLAAMSLGICMLWEQISLDETLSGHTAMVVIPDFGRNSYPNSLLDEYGAPGFDHNIEDPLTSKIFCVVAGPAEHIRQGVVSDFCGANTDVVSIIRDLRHC